MEGSRREFLKKSLKIGAIGTSVVAASVVTANTGGNLQSDSNGVVVGKSNKKEVLYKKSQEWEYYYKIAY